VTLAAAAPLHLLTNIRALYACRAEGQAQADAHMTADAAIVWRGERIVWVGAAAAVPQDLLASPDLQRHDAAGALAIPGLIDAHTHLAFAGWRDNEFSMRCQGATYQEVAAAGGGILSTARATRAASQADLANTARARLDAMLRLGVTTVEAKSGYGLTVEDELKTLRAYKTLHDHPVSVIPTVLAAHALPPEHRHHRQGWLDLLTDALLPAVAADSLAVFVDAFVEVGAFTIDEARHVFNAARRLGITPRLHADQLSDTGGGALAAEVCAASADHLEFVSDASLAAMARAQTIAVTLPIATLYLRQPPLDARRCFAAGVPVAVATDFNPGSAPSYHLPWAMTLACTLNHMTPAQALQGATRVAAQSLRLTDRGSLLPGLRADITLLDAPSLDHWLYHPQPNACRATFCAGQLAYTNPSPPWPT
jgi:imidazolonepropionase